MNGKCSPISQLNSNTPTSLATNRTVAMAAPSTGAFTPRSAIVHVCGSLDGLAVADDGEIDALIVIFTPPVATHATEVAAAIHGAIAQLRGSVPVLCVLMAGHSVRSQLAGDEVRVPLFAFPEEAARALAHAVRYGRWLARPDGVAPDLDGVRVDQASAVIAAALAQGPGWLQPEQVAALFDCYGLPLAEWRVAVTSKEARTAGGQLAGPVAIKAAAPGLVHKSEAGAVRLGLVGQDAVAPAVSQIRRSVRAAGHHVERFLIQRMAPDGVEMLVGVVHDPLFGPVVALAAGGAAVELTSDVAVRITPLTDLDVREMVRSLATFPLLDGYRGAPKADVAALEDVLLRVGALVEAHPEVAEMDCNPVMALEVGAAIVDARVRIEQAPPHQPLLARRN